jgi:hypothetical protein
MKTNEIIKELKGPDTKGDWVVAKRNVVLQHMLGTNFSLRNVATAAQFLDNVLKQMKSPEGWTDKKGVTHYADDLYQGKIGIWPPSEQPVVSNTGTADPYKKEKQLTAGKY